MTLLGAEIIRDDARGKASGQALYTQDIDVPGMLHGALTRSVRPSARILSIETAAAGAVPGVVAVLTARDLPARRYGVMTADEPILAADVVRYVGEPVALVAARTRDIARQAAALVRVEYDDLPAVVTLPAALAADAPRVQEELPNLFDQGTIERGDVDAAFATAHAVVETRVESQRAHQGYIEPRVSLAELDGGRLKVTTSSQAPYEVRAGLAQLFDLPISQVGVRVPTLGGGFGGKLHLGMAPYAAALALATGRAVQVLCSREEEMQSPAPRENSLVVLRSAVNARGRITARTAEIYLDSGAYAYDTPALHSTAAHQACGPYDIESVRVLAASVLTHTVPTGSFRAPTGPQMAYANEKHIADIAGRLALDPLEVRRRNIMRSGGRGPGGQVLANPAMETCLEKVEEVISRWRATAGRPAAGHARGIGVGCSWWNTYPGGSAATVTMSEDGSATIHTGATEIGTGAVSTAIKAIVADAFGLEATRVRLASGDTDGAPYDFGSQGSRTLYAAGGAADLAAQDVRGQLARYVADEIEADTRDLVFEGGSITVAGSPDTGMSLAAAVAGLQARSGPVSAVASFQPIPPSPEPGCVQSLAGGAFNEPSFHCHVAEIDINRATGHIRVLRYAAIHDVGPVLNPAGLRGQIEGGIVQGIGYTLYEEILTDDGGVTRNPNLVDYRLPTIADVPEELEIHTVTDYAAEGSSHGAKGIGEGPIIPVAATIGSAVRDALGDQPGRLPLDCARIRDLAKDPRAVV